MSDSEVAANEPKDVLRRYLVSARDALLWKLDGLSPYDMRRPLTPTGTNLLGLVKHVGSVGAGYFGFVFDRPFPEPMPWAEENAADNAEMWVTTDESTEQILDFYRRAWAHADATIDALDLDSPGHVPWWPGDGVTLQRILVHVIAEINRHAGHADILREQLDASAGLNARSSNLPEHDEAWWQDYYAQVEAAAKAAE